VVDGEDDDGHIGIAFGDDPRGVEPAALGHVDVHEDDVGPVLGHPLQHLLAVLGLPHYFHVRLQRQNLDQPLPQQRVVIGDDDADRHPCPPPPFAPRAAGRSPAPWGLRTPPRGPKARAPAPWCPGPGRSSAETLPAGGSPAPAWAAAQSPSRPPAPRPLPDRTPSRRPPPSCRRRWAQTPPAQAPGGPGRGAGRCGWLPARSGTRRPRPWATGAAPGPAPAAPPPAPSAP